MSVDSTALEEYDYYEDVEPVRWNTFDSLINLVFYYLKNYKLEIFLNFKSNIFRYLYIYS